MSQKSLHSAQELSSRILLLKGYFTKMTENFIFGILLMNAAVYFLKTETKNQILLNNLIEIISVQGSNKIFQDVIWTEKS